MRNLLGHRFVHSAGEDELMRVMAKVFRASESCPIELETFKDLTNAERDYLVGCRLVSPDFEWSLPGRAVLIDRARSVGIMINEEDHVRVQALTAGLSFHLANRICDEAIAGLAHRLEFAFSPKFGYLSASHINLGPGKRISAMFHLIGLAQMKRLPAVIAALAARGISVRGLFGESSRAVGAYAQISVLSGNRQEFAGACEYLVEEERRARREVGWERLIERANRAREFALGSQAISLADALRVLGWIRWGASAQIPGFHLKSREIDAALAGLEIRGTMQEELAAMRRAATLREAVEGGIKGA
jgi:protein arginine kinase